jgi:hypothetical protein
MSKTRGAILRVRNVSQTRLMSTPVCSASAAHVPDEQPASSMMSHKWAILSKLEGERIEL